MDEPPGATAARLGAAGGSPLAACMRTSEATKSGLIVQRNDRSINEVGCAQPATNSTNIHVPCTNLQLVIRPP
eukprot:1462794-Prymnesium_polylepis.2